MQDSYGDSFFSSGIAAAKRRWQRIVVALSAFVVFCTVYMLILPAMTMERETYCGMQEHEHGEGCYEIVSILTCGYPEESTTADNTALQTSEAVTEEESSVEPSSEEHSSEKTETESTTPAQNEPEVHIHTEDCYESDIKQLCSLPEHTHEDSCFVSDETTTDENAQQDEDYSIGFLGDEYEAEPQADAQITVTRTDFDNLDGSGETYYVVYTSYNGKYYAMDGNGSPVEITVNSNGTVTSDSLGNNLYWTFSNQSGTSYYICNLGTSRYMHSYYNSSTNNGVTTSGKYTSSLETTGSGTGYYITGGRYAEIKWYRNTDTGAFIFTTPEGLILTVERGTSFIAMVDQTLKGTSAIDLNFKLAG